MIKRYLFASTVTETDLSIVEIDKEIRAQQMSFKALSKHNNAQNILVIPTEDVSILDAKLPNTSNTKLAKLIPYAVEDNLITPIEQLHFAFDKAFYKNECYLILAVNKALLATQLEFYTDKNITIQAVTIDWFALNEFESIQNGNRILVNTQKVKGALQPEIYQLSSDLPPITNIDTEINTSPEAWIAKRLDNAGFINLLQASFASKSASPMQKSKWAAGISIGLFLSSYIITHAIQLHHLGQRNQQIDAQIETIYKLYFPEAKQVISPKFRLTQWLKNKKNHGDEYFWQLLSTFNDAVNLKHTTIKSMHFKSTALIIDLSLSNFDSLDQLVNDLKKAGAGVKQTDAHTENNQVIAKLEIS